MKIEIAETKLKNSQKAAEAGANILRELLIDRGSASIMLSSGTSQVDLLEFLALSEEIDWRLVTIFHTCEYIGIPVSHPASIRRYFTENFLSKLPILPGAFHLLEGDSPDTTAECRRMSGIIAKHKIDIAFIGIGENAHIAFNDPPADFATDDPYIKVDLDNSCRQQQVNEGWFSEINLVPKTAISMSVHQLMLSKQIICTVSDAQYALAISNAVDGPLTPLVPASILRQHHRCTLFLASHAASLLKGRGAAHI